MNTQPQPAEPLDLDVVETRHHQIADPAACGTCWRLALAGQPTEHPACARRAVLLPAPDAPDYEDLADLTDEQKAALPARFHTPVWEGNAVPHSWVCAVCWGDGWVTRWPCKPAIENGDEVFTPEHQATRARQDVPALLARVRELEAELTRATRSSYSGRHVWEAWAEEGDRTICTTEAAARAAAIQIRSEAAYDGSDDAFTPDWHETKWGLELLDDGEHTGVFVARQDVFGTRPAENAPGGPARPV
jgi:hypothetical protein